MISVGIMTTKLDGSNSKDLTAKDPQLNAKLKALIVDDNAFQRKIIGAFFKKINVEFEEAENGKKAVEFFQAGAKFDIITMDKEMPVMDGLEATRILRSMGVATAIVGVSTITKEKEIQEFMDAGLDEFHTKPIGLAKLEAIVKKLGKGI